MQRIAVWVVLTLVAGCQPPAEPDSGRAPAAGFRPPEELVDGWYHRHERSTWRAKGAQDAVVDAVLKRIEEAPGERSNPEWVDSIANVGPGNWVYEWSLAGEAALKRAERARAAGEPADALVAQREALAYFTIASWPHPGDPADKAALARARVAYLAVTELLALSVQHVEFPVGTSSSRGYLHLPPGAGPFPVVLLTYGSDVTKEDGLGLFTSELLPRRIALMSVDMPGIGEADHLSLLDGSDQVLQGAFAWLSRQASVDPERIFIVGASFGGNAAARAFFNLEPAGVISMCAPLHSPFVAPAGVYDSLPALTMDGVKARVGLKGGSNEALAEVAPRLSLKNQGYFDGAPVATPLLVLTTNRDPVAPLADLAGLLARAADADTIVLDQVGHCPPRPVRQPIVARWVADRL